MQHFQVDPKNKTLRVMVARPGVDIPVDGMWVRYAHFLGVPPSDMVPYGQPRQTSPPPGGLEQTFLQTHLGYSVHGCGYLVTSERGMIRSVMGKVMTNLPASLPKPIDEKSAFDIAMRLAPTKEPFPWQTEPKRWKEPARTLILKAPKEMQEPVGSNFKLVWVFNFSGSGVNDLGGIEMDAETGEQLDTWSNLVQ